MWMLKQLLAACLVVMASHSSVVAETLDDYWLAVSKTVAAGDFAGYAATYHPDAVYVDGIKGISYPIKDAFARWQQGFEDTAAGNMTASVEFKFSTSRLGEETAHQTGMFHYAFANKNGENGEYFVHFEALLTQKDGWKMMMEYQKKAGTEEEWDQLGQ